MAHRYRRALIALFGLFCGMASAAWMTSAPYA